MLFNSYAFLLFFLPVTLAGWFAFGRWVGLRWAQVWLVATSLFYYGWWNPWYLILIVGLTLANYGWGRVLAAKASKGLPRGWALALGLVVNLSVLGYFKYANFFVDNADALLGANWVLAKVILPLGISFFTFQKIGYLVDCSRGLVPKGNFLSFALFVVFFPQLIAGPITHHGEVIPQFSKDGVTRPNMENLAVGATMLVFGLAKKVLLADPLSERIAATFSDAAQGNHLPLSIAWYGVLAYALQLYFDFSGYTDMAIGLARMFNITLPQNFNSPYQSNNIVEFWRRWHMTLSRFLRDYLYIPLGGNRHGHFRRYIHLLVTMLLGGLWHGANWTFAAWGLLHGFYLAANHAWLEAKTQLGVLAKIPAPWRLAVARGLTFTAVLAGWVLFRSKDFSSAAHLFHELVNFSGNLATPVTGAPRPERWAWLGVLYIVIFLAPNTQDILSRFSPVLGVKEASTHSGLCGGRLLWNPATRWAVFCAIIVTACLLSLSNVTEFLYYQF